MQFMVQGAWGVVPAWLSELSPGPVRATFPGLAYQLGNLISSKNVVIQAKAAERLRRVRRRAGVDGSDCGVLCGAGGGVWAGSREGRICRRPRALADSRGRLFGRAAQDSFGGAQIFFGVDADGVAGGGGDVDVDAIVEEAELLEALDAARARRAAGWRIARARLCDRRRRRGACDSRRSRCRRDRRGWWRGRSRERGRRRR